MISTLALGHRAATPARSNRGSGLLATWPRLVLMLVAAACVLYLVQANRLATRGYQIEALREQVEQLRRENRDLESQALKLQSLPSLTSRVSNLEMVPAGNVIYLSTLPPATARADVSLR